MSRMCLRERIALMLASLVALPTARAQCPDGSPPPCRTQTVAVAPRRVNPPLDDRTWIVVPFDNLARNSEVDWLRNASVNLLYLDMSRWKDIRVIDDERVADLMREVPEVNTANQSLSLNAGLAVAKRAGAGKLVMGDVLKLGNRTAVTAKVFDVRTGQRTKSVREETTVQDSVMSLFGKLAQKVLNVAAPQGANVGALGTTRVDAYQEYIAGVAALNRFDLGEARIRLEQALKLDSAFALAHFKLSIVMGWDDSNSPLRRSHAEAAARLSAGLPPRERALITGQLQQSHGDWTKACETYGALARADTADIEAWYGVGECLFHDNTIEAVNGDTTRLRFRADWAQSIKAFEHVLQLDPTYHLAYQHIIDALTNERHSACYYSDPTARCVSYTGLLIRAGDSLVVTPVSPNDTAKMRIQGERYMQTRSRRRNLQIANAAASAWVASSPDEARARHALASVLLLQGRLLEASTAIAGARGGSLIDQLRMLMQRMEIQYKLGRASDAIRLYDSLRTANIPIPGGNPPQFGNALAGFGPAFGRIVEFDSILVTAMRQAPPLVREHQRYAIRAAFFGAIHDSLTITERAVFDQTRDTRGANAATREISTSLIYAMRAARAMWPAVDTTMTERRLQPALALARGDTARLRRAARSLDSLEAAIVASGGSDSGFAVVAADSYLALRDSLAALSVLRLALDSALVTTTLFPLQNAQGNMLYVVPRMMLMRADLAAALGQKDEAKTWYKRFVDIFATAAPELQPIVDRARKSLAALGP